MRRRRRRAELPSYFTAASERAGRMAIRRVPDEINVHAGEREECVGGYVTAACQQGTYYGAPAKVHSARR